MAMTNRNNTKFDSIIMHTLDELVPQDHLVRKLENALDFRFIYPKVRHCYSRHGRPSIDPVVLFKMLMINILFGYNYAKDLSGNSGEPRSSLVPWIGHR